MNTNNINYNEVPLQVRRFVRMLTTTKTTGFAPIVACTSVQTVVENDNWQVDFCLVKDTWVNLTLIYPSIPKRYSCQSLGYSDGILTVGFTPKTILKSCK